MKPTSFEMFAAHRGRILDEFLGRGENRVQMSWHPPISISARVSPEPVQTIAEFVSFFFYLTLLQVKDHGTGEVKRFLKVTDLNGDVMELRPASYSELTSISNHANRG